MSSISSTGRLWWMVILLMAVGSACGTENSAPSEDDSTAGKGNPDANGGAAGSSADPPPEPSRPGAGGNYGSSGSGFIEVDAFPKEIPLASPPVLTGAAKVEVLNLLDGADSIVPCAKVGDADVTAPFFPLTKEGTATVPRGAASLEQLVPTTASGPGKVGYFLRLARGIDCKQAIPGVVDRPVAGLTPGDRVSWIVQGEPYGQGPLRVRVTTVYDDPRSLPSSATELGLYIVNLSENSAFDVGASDIEGSSFESWRSALPPLVEGGPDELVTLRPEPFSVVKRDGPVTIRFRKTGTNSWLGGRGFWDAFTLNREEANRRVLYVVGDGSDLRPYVLLDRSDLVDFSSRLPFPDEIESIPRPGYRFANFHPGGDEFEVCYGSGRGTDPLKPLLAPTLGRGLRFGEVSQAFLQPTAFSYVGGRGTTPVLADISYQLFSVTDPPCQKPLIDVFREVGVDMWGPGVLRFVQTAYPRTPPAPEVASAVAYVLSSDYSLVYEPDGPPRVEVGFTDDEGTFSPVFSNTSGPRELSPRKADHLEVRRAWNDAFGKPVVYFRSAAPVTIAARERYGILVLPRLGGARGALDVRLCRAGPASFTGPNKGLLACDTIASN